MIIDYGDAASPQDMDADICIIGAGVAGLSVARPFIGTAFTVCIIAGGGMDAEERYQALYEGSSIGCPPFDPAASRMRAFGGTCNLWGRGCIPMGTALDRRDWVPHSGWPVTYAELESDYRRASAFCGIESHDFGKGSFLSQPELAPLDFDEQKLVTRIFAASPVHFGSDYRSEFERAPNVRVLLHANLTGLQATPGGSAVEEARIATLDGKHGRVRARHYVLAAGGIENARLLLLSDSVVPQGLGNDRDLVGRYFMDHPSGKLGTIVTDKPETLTRPYDRNLAKGPLPSHPEICLSDEAQQEHGILNARLRPFAVEGSVPRGIQALRGLKAARSAKSRDWELSLKERLCIRHNGEPQYVREVTPPAESTARLALGLGLGIGDLAWAAARKLAGKPTVKTAHVDVVGYFEQAPNPESRITLGSETDALGLRRVCVDWRLNPLDMRTYRVAARLFGDELARACQGRFELEPWLRTDDNPVPEVFGTSHHMGTTRMSEDPASGVVDRDCKVHGVDNLHVAGSSVFPAGGWAFPTFTIVALGLRLAGHLHARLEQSPVELSDMPARRAVA